jgi:hypothetical protein
LGGLEGEPAGAHVTDMQDPRIYQAFQDGLTTGEFTPADQAFFTSAGPAPLLSHIHIPVLLMQGTDDTLFTLREAITNYEALQNQHVPVQMLWFCGSLSDNPGVAHGQCLTPKGPDPQITLHFELRWLARYLKQDRSVNTGPGFTWISDAGTEHTTPSYPPASSQPVTGSGSGTLPLVPGDTSGELIVASRAANAVNVPLNTPGRQDGRGRLAPTRSSGELEDVVAVIDVEHAVPGRVDHQAKQRAGPGFPVRDGARYFRPRRSVRHCCPNPCRLCCPGGCRRRALSEGTSSSSGPE